jgi:hypothetical protein
MQEQRREGLHACGVCDCHQVYIMKQAEMGIGLLLGDWPFAWLVIRLACTLACHVHRCRILGRSSLLLTRILLRSPCRPVSARQ